MDKIKERAAQFNDGLISEREFLGFLIEIIGDIWTNCEMEANETTLRFTRELADKLVS